MTQPQGHSSSGSHERYKPAERMAWEEEADPVRHMREWLLDQKLASEADDSHALEAEALARSPAGPRCRARGRAHPAGGGAGRSACREAGGRWPSIPPQRDAARLAGGRSCVKARQPQRKPNMEVAHRALLLTRDESTTCPRRPARVVHRRSAITTPRKLTARISIAALADSPLHVDAVAPIYAERASRKPAALKLLRDNFRRHSRPNDPRVFIFGEDVGASSAT